MKWGRSPLFSLSFVTLAGLCSALAWGAESVLERPDGGRIVYSVETPGGPGSALETAQRLHAHLAAGQLAEAAALSNTPRRRHQVLHDFRAAVGVEEMKQLYQAYLHPENRVVAEIAIGEHRLLLWKLVGLERLAGEFFVNVDGRLLLDDIPSDTRAQLRLILQHYRQEENSRQTPITRPPAAQ